MQLNLELSLGNFVHFDLMSMFQKLDFKSFKTHVNPKKYSTVIFSSERSCMRVVNILIKLYKSTKQPEVTRCVKFLPTALELHPKASMAWKIVFGQNDGQKMPVKKVKLLGNIKVESRETFDLPVFYWS